MTVQVSELIMLVQLPVLRKFRNHFDLRIL